MIILTDYPKSKLIKAHLRGCETEFLEKILKQMFHLMMSFYVEQAGGYSIEYNYEDVKKELKWRGINLDVYL